MAAPHVSGAVAVLLDFFPELTPDQIVARLLETADSNGIYANASIFGQGLLDLGAATQPVGVAVILTGETTAGAAYALGSTQIQLGAAFGDGFMQSLQGAKLAVFDKYHATFVVDLAPFVQIADNITDVGALLERFRTVSERIALGEGSFLSMRFSGGGGEPGSGDGSRLEAFSFVTALDETTEAAVNYNLHPGQSFGLHKSGTIDRSLVMSDGAFLAPYLSLADQGYNFAASTKLGDLGTLRFGSFFGQPDEAESSSGASGSMVELAMPLTSRGGLSLQLGLMAEEETLLGSQTKGAFDTASTPTYFGGVTAELGLTDRISVVGSYFAGVSTPAPADGSLFSDISSVRSNSFSLGVVTKDALTTGARAGFVVNQPLRVTNAEAKLSLATGRTRDGNVLKQEFVADLAPDGRELDLEVFYEAPLGEQSTIGASAMLRTEPGHMRSAENEGVFMFKFSHKF